MGAISRQSHNGPGRWSGPDPHLWGGGVLTIIVGPGLPWWSVGACTPPPTPVVRRRIEGLAARRRVVVRRGPGPAARRRGVEVAGPVRHGRLGGVCHRRGGLRAPQGLLGGPRGPGVGGLGDDDHHLEADGPQGRIR